MATLADYVSRVTGKLDEQIKSHTDTLIACEAHRHDRIAGQIAGLTSARKSVSDEARRFQAGSEE